jgi:uncharacterized membrane protein YedE/YeeE
MQQSESPLNRSIGLSGVLRWLIAVFAMIAVGAAFAAGHIVLGIVGIAVIVGAALLGFQAWRARQAAGHADSPEAGL